jgi:hypothetical protein
VALSHVHFRRGCRGRDLPEIDEVRFVRLAIVDQGEAAAADSARGRVDDAGREGGRDRSVDCVAAVLEHFDSGFGGELVLRGHHAARRSGGNERPYERCEQEERKRELSGKRPQAGTFHEA